jgi:hypothetical protein
MPWDTWPNMVRNSERMGCFFSSVAEEFRESVVQSSVKKLDDSDEDVRKSAVKAVTQLMKIGMKTQFSRSR